MTTFRINAAGILLPIALLTVRADAQSAGTSLTYVSGSSVKLEQVIGDCDWEAEAQQIVMGKPVTCTPTPSQTVTQVNVLATDIGTSFEDNGKVTIMFGDTMSGNGVDFHQGDVIASGTTTDPESPMKLTFYKNPDGSPLFVRPPGVAMGGDDTPNAGISLSSGVYIVCNTGSDFTLASPQQNEFSILAQFNETAQTFTKVRTISPVGGRFIYTALHSFGTNVVIFGEGPYRGSDIFLQMVPQATFSTEAGTQYFAGLVNGQPTWASTEAEAVPVVQDNPLNGPAWPNDSPSVGNISIAYSTPLNLWLMTYDGGRKSAKTAGVYFTYATNPWGPWATPQLIFNDKRDDGKGVFIHDPSSVPDPPGDGLNGPVTGGSNGPYATAGGSYAPLMIERFLTVTGNTLKIYYTMSTWNPYTVVRMRSEFTIATPPSAPAIASGSVANGATYVTAGLVPGSWAQLKGTNLATVSNYIWQSADFVGLGNNLPMKLQGTSVTVNGLPAAVYYVDLGQVNFQVPEGVSGTASVQVSVNGAASNIATAASAASAPGIFPVSVNGTNYPAGVFLDGKYVGDPSVGPAFRNAKAGDVIELYATGLVPTPSGVLPTSQGVSGVTVTIGSVSVPATFAGLVAVGEFQINFTVPQQFATLPAGTYPITISVSGVSSPATINSSPPGPLVIPIQH